jgi:hypothetical protein
MFDPPRTETSLHELLRRREMPSFDVCNHEHCPITSLGDGVLNDPVSESRVYFAWCWKNKWIMVGQSHRVKDFQFGLKPLFLLDVADYIMKGERAFAQSDGTFERDRTPVIGEVVAIEGACLCFCLFMLTCWSLCLYNFHILS